MKFRVLSLLLTIGSIAGFSHPQVVPLAGAEVGIEVSPGVPGARSLGLGGAFVAVADDATAAFANPAGLGQLIRPEISLEFRSWQYDPENLASSMSGIGFGSFVYPFDNWTLAVYLHSMAVLDFISQPNDSPFTGNTISIGTSLTVFNFGASASYTVSDRLSLGLGATTAVGQFSSLGGAVNWFPGWLEGSLPPSFEASTSSVGVVAGATWQMTEDWSLAAAYRPGAELVFQIPQEADTTDEHTTEDYFVVIPDVFAFGASYRSPSGHVVVGLEWDRLQSHEGARNQLRLGTEYVFLDVTPLIGLRLGLWHAPSSTSSPDRSTDEFHLSLGLGVAFRKLQLDAAADLSDSVSTYSLSAIYSF
ncbi:MAG: hypothetical protein GY906_08830 [bacterium]|nr:hypothetical protein [bacterium]